MDWFLDLNQDPLDIFDTVSTYADGFHGQGEQLLQNQNANAPANEHNEDVGESPDPLQNVSSVAGGHQAVGNNSGTLEQSSSIPTVAANIGATDEAGVGTGHEPGPEIDLEEALSQPQEPHVGMRFDTLIGARDHYNAYAAKKGFSIKSNTSRRSVFTGQVQKQQFVCNKFKKPVVNDGAEKVGTVPKINLEAVDESDEENGEDEDVVIFDDPKKKRRKKRKREKIIQTGCKAKIVVKEIEERWEVIYFISEHNHPLVTKPDLVKYLRSHHGIPDEEKEFLTILHNCNLTTGRMFDVMSEFYGSGFNVPYNPRTLTNFRATLTAPTREFDLAETQDYFHERQKEDPDFYFKSKLDAEGRVQNLFWVDGAARKAYTEAYNDCISFDTTYLTNMYNMPFAPFIGINRHGQSFMLGCGFVRQELATSYDWLFLTFLDAMQGKAPGCIITDQDIAMKQSIARIFRNRTVHRNCRWHIMQKSNQKMGSWLGRHPELVKEFNDIVDFSMSPEEFEARWLFFAQKWSQDWHTHLDTLYENRNVWVPCYFRHCFFPFLQSTQRSEGFNAVLKRYVNPHNSILNFVKQYEKIQVLILVKQGGNDFRTDQLEMDTWSPYPIELQAFKVYTRDIYMRFRTEFEMIGRYNVRPDANGMYQLVPNRTYCAKYGSRTYLVSANVEQSMYSCECCKMQRDGLLCVHILKVFTHLGIDEIPLQYISKRWTQQAIEGEVAGGAEEVVAMPEQSKKQIWYANLSTNFQKAAKKCCVSDAAEAIANKHLRALETEVNHMNMTRRKARSAAATPARQKNNAPDAPTGSVPSATPGRVPAARQGRVPVPPGTAPVGPPGSAPVGPTGSASVGPPDSAPVSAPDGSAGSSRPLNPLKVSTKGRKKATRTVSALELQPKRVTKCSLCESTEHNAGTCSLRLL